MSEEERIYTIPLGRAWAAQGYRRAEKAMMLLRKFTERHMKPTKVVIDPSVNERLWVRGIRNPPRKIRVKMTKDDEGVVVVELAEVKQ